MWVRGGDGGTRTEHGRVKSFGGGVGGRPEWGRFNLFFYHLLSALSLPRFL